MQKKSDIITRLYTSGAITVEEMWVLLEDTPQVKYITLPDINHLNIEDEVIDIPNFPDE